MGQIDNFFHEYLFFLQCNNPLTKEAKLTAAMRILPEWKGYDEEVRKLQQKIDSGVLDPESEEAEDVPETGN